MKVRLLAGLPLLVQKKTSVVQLKDNLVLSTELTM